MNILKLKIITCFSIFAMIFTACEQDLLIPNVTEQLTHDEPMTPRLVQGNTPHVCATYHPSGHDENHSAKMKIKDIYDNYANNVNFRNNAQVYTVPVIFHVLWKEHEGITYGDIQASQIDRAIEILNADFNQTNDQSFIPQNFLNIAGDSQIKFVLAEKDPNGVCLSEAGISRVESDNVFDGSDVIPCGNSYGSEMQREFHWPRDKYLNIYLVDYISTDEDGDCEADSDSGSTSGYASFPTDVDQSPSLDGIVLNYRNLGDTGEAVDNNDPSLISHEVGHWLNLDHTWGQGAFGTCGNDGIDDTPQTSGNDNDDFPNNCSNYTNNTCGSDDNVHNFMDYACESMFTNGQVAAMRSVLTSSLSDRNNLWSASNLSAVMDCTGGSCATPSTSEITHTEYSTMIYVYALSYNGINHQFRYRVNGGSWVNLPATNSYYSTITNKQANSTYEIQLQLCGNNWSDTVTIGNGGGSCATPSTSEITHTEYSTMIYVYALSYNGINHQFRYRVNGGSWVNLPATNSYYSTITNKQANSTYEVQLQLCDNNWSDTVTIGNSGCSTPSPSISEITHTEYSTLIYVYALSYNGINHQFRYRINGGSWVNLPATNSHYSTITNKQNCATYEIQLKVKCSEWSGTETITTSC